MSGIKGTEDHAIIPLASLPQIQLCYRDAALLMFWYQWPMARIPIYIRTNICEIPFRASRANVYIYSIVFGIVLTIHPD